MTIDIQRAIEIISRFGHLQVDEAEAVMNQIMAGEAGEAQIGAYLMGLRMKGETQDEIIGSARAMRANAIHVPTGANGDLLDTCGTGGDKSGTFNISTTVAFVAAAAGVRVAKHGNRAATSKCGSADVLAELGVNLDLTPEQVGQCVDEIGIGFLYAPKLHPAMKYASVLRRQVGVRTIFNILGPLTNPAGAPNILMGVFHEDLVGIQVRALQRLGAEHALVVYGRDGLDEISLGAGTMVGELKDGVVREYEIHPEDFGLRMAGTRALKVETPEDSKAMLMGVLQGEPGPARDIVCLNAGAALYAANVVTSIEEGLQRAQAVIDSGAALKKLHELVAYSQKLSA